MTKNSYKISVTTDDERTFPASIRYNDAISGISIIEITAVDLKPVIAMGSIDAMLGNIIFTLGCNSNSSNGIISAQTKHINIDGEIMALVQTDAYATQTSYGGGLFDKNGYFLGLITTADNNTGMSYIVPSDFILNVTFDYFSQGYVGGRVNENIFILEEIINPSPLRSRQGLYVSKKISAFQTPVEKDFYITAVNGKQITTTKEWIATLRQHKPGETLVVSYYVSDSKFGQFELELEELKVLPSIR
ncbi:MAG: S1C family serine protease, partial [Christensenellaceae bacterium]|jgi:S1-C subfamily serine protease|nr:S1C family serine protease [Christensenellaceae bacterium]